MSNVLQQLDEGVGWGSIDVDQALGAGVQGAVSGALVVSLSAYVSAILPAACAVVPLLAGAASAVSVYDGIMHVRDGKYYSGSLQIALGVTGLWAVGSGLVTRAVRGSGGTCFVAGTQVVVDMHLPPAVALAGCGDARSGGRGLEALGTTLLLVGVVGVVPWERRRRREQREEREGQFSIELPLRRDRPLEKLLGDAVYHTTEFRQSRT